MGKTYYKEKSIRFLEVRDPKKALGLWSHTIEFSATLHPITPTRETLGRFFNDDLARFETHAEALKMMAAKGWKKTSSRKINEYAAQYLGERVDENGKSEWLAVPRWFRAWHRFSRWLENSKTAEPYRDVRLSFGAPSTGRDCGDLRHRTSRVIFLKKNGRNFVGVMMKDGWYAWNIIEKSAYQDDPYERLLLFKGRGLVWQTVDADIITELLQAKQMCLFEMEKNPIFDALTDSKNHTETLGFLSRAVELYVHDPNGAEERFYIRFGATFNPTKRKYDTCDKNQVRLVEVMKERGKGWIDRQIPVTESSQIENAARWVVENNGCIVLPPDRPDSLRQEVMRALFYVTFPDRPIDAPGGILRGYQMPGRMVQYATKRIRFDGDAIREKQKANALETRKRKRKLIVDTLLDRAARVVAERNGIQKDTAKKRIEKVGGRAIIETAAWRWGFMEGHPLVLFTAAPQAGSLKLPDLSLAIGFEHRLGLEGNKASVGKLVQTAKIVELSETFHCNRFCKDFKIVASRSFSPRQGAESDKISYSTETARIIYDRDGGLYYLLLFPKYALYQYERDLLFEPGENSVSVKAYRCVSEDGTRSRQNNHIEEETFDFNKIVSLAKDGRVYLYVLDVGEAKWLFDATYTTQNGNPCKIIPTLPQLFQLNSPLLSARRNNKNGVYIFTDIPTSAEKVELRISFTINPYVIRDGRKYEGRSWKSYCDAYPDDAGRETVVWPTGNATKETLKEAANRVVETDGVLLTDEEHLSAALEGMGYVVTQTEDPHAPGGIYNGYMLVDRVFKSSDGRVTWREENGLQRKEVEDGKFDRQRYAEEKRKENAGKPLVEVLSPAIAAAAEREFSERIEAEVLADKKTSKFFTLEAPIVIGDEFKAMVAREFRRVAYTGTMGWRQQLVRPAHEVALGIWLARLKPDLSKANAEEG